MRFAARAAEAVGRLGSSGVFRHGAVYCGPPRRTAKLGAFALARGVRLAEGERAEKPPHGDQSSQGVRLLESFGNHRVDQHGEDGTGRSRGDGGHELGGGAPRNATNPSTDASPDTKAIAVHKPNT